MKTFEKILLGTVLFFTLFYDEGIGVNFGILGASYALITYFTSAKTVRTRMLKILLATTLCSAAAFAWYGDFVSGLAVVISLTFLVLKSKSKELKPVLALPLLFLNIFAFIFRIFIDPWLPKFKTTGATQKILAAFVIPAVFIGIFFAIYSAGSDVFANVFSGWEWNLDLLTFTVIAILGFYFSFLVFSFWVPDFFYSKNHLLKNDFVNEDKALKPTWSFLDVSSERLSGVISFAALCILLSIFIGTYNYEQFFEMVKTPAQLSKATHEGVNAVILSIAMSILVVMFYFKSGFNFDDSAKVLKTLAKVWIILNAVLVVSAIVKNTEYFVNYGATYRRLGVFAFLLLALIGLYYTFLKIQAKKTNAFLVNKMAWYFYAAVLACSFVNWGALASSYNIQHKKGDAYLLYNFEFNERVLKANGLEYDEPYEKSFLSDQLFYRTLEK